LQGRLNFRLVIVFVIYLFILFLFLVFVVRRIFRAVV